MTGVVDTALDRAVVPGWGLGHRCLRAFQRVRACSGDVAQDARHLDV